MAFNPVLLASVVLLVLGNLFHIIGLSTPEWATLLDDLLTFGLWEACVDDVCTDTDDSSNPDWYKACKAMAILGMIVGLAAIVVVAIVFVMQLLGKDPPRIPRPAIPGVAVLSSVMILITIIIFAAKYEDDFDIVVPTSAAINLSIDLGYSFALSVVGAVLILAGGFAGFFGYKES